MRRNVLLIDNLDSFSFNLVEAFERLGATVRVVRNTIDAAQALAFARDEDALIVLSPGPGRPEDAGCTLELIGLAYGRVPVLGICLGHQAIVHEAGGAVERASEPFHGRSTTLEHDGAGPLFGLEQSLRAQGKDAEAKQVAKEFKQAWKHADVKPDLSWF